MAGVCGVVYGSGGAHGDGRSSSRVEPGATLGATPPPGGDHANSKAKVLEEYRPEGAAPHARRARETAQETGLTKHKLAELNRHAHRKIAI